MGAKAAFQSVKAVVNACGYLANDSGAPLDRFLGLQVTSESDREGGEGREGRELQLLVLPAALPREELELKKESYTDLLVGNATEAKKAAAAMAGALRPQGGGHGKHPVVRAMGSQAVHRALLAAMLAQKYLDSDGRGLRFCVVPYFSRDLAQESSSKQLVLRLVRLLEHLGRTFQLSLCEEGQRMRPNTFTCGRNGAEPLGMLSGTALVFCLRVTGALQLQPDQGAFSALSCTLSPLICQCSIALRAWDHEASGSGAQ